MRPVTETNHWWVPTAAGTTRLAHLLPDGPYSNPHAVTTAPCGERRRGWEPHDPTGTVTRCPTCARAAQARTPLRQVPQSPSGQRWWIPASVLHAKITQAHLLPPDSDGSRGAALCGEGHLSWALIGAQGARVYCHACEVIGGRRQIAEGGVPEARKAALVVAQYCATRPLEPEVAEMPPAAQRAIRRRDLQDLLEMLLEHPHEARRAA